MKKIAFISASALLCTSVLVSCTSNKMAVNSFDDNLYFMSADVKKATENAVANNQPATFQNLASSTVVPQENFSSKNVNPEYLSRYGQLNTSSGEDVVYFEENQSANNSSTPNIDVYNTFRISNFNSGWGNSGWGNSAFNFGYSPFGMGMMGMSPFGMGMYDPFFNPGWGWRSGFNLGFGMGMGWGRPFYNPFNSYLGFGGFYDPFWGINAMGSPWGWNRPIYTSGPIIIMPGNEFGNRNIVYGARPSRGASLSNGGGGVIESVGTPNTARAQARENAANANGASPRRLVSTESNRSATRDFSTSQNDYYSSGRSRVENSTRNVNSAASSRGDVAPSRSSAQSARPSSTPSSTGRGYNSNPYSDSYNTGATRSTNSSPSYNRSSGSNNGATRSTSYGRSESNGYNSGSAPSRSNYNSSGFSAPSRSSSGESFSAPSRSSSGSSGSSSSGGSRGRGN
ncbi:MAG: hypothetical protein RJA23_1778 [Bacteroidota bacterium]|jgi:hypothetical protein